MMLIELSEMGAICLMLVYYFGTNGSKRTEARVNTTWSTLMTSSVLIHSNIKPDTETHTDGDSQKVGRPCDTKHVWILQIIQFT